MERAHLGLRHLVDGGRDEAHQRHGERAHRAPLPVPLRGDGKRERLGGHRQRDASRGLQSPPVQGHAPVAAPVRQSLDPDVRVEPRRRAVAAHALADAIGRCILVRARALRGRVVFFSGILVSRRGAERAGGGRGAEPRGRARGRGHPRVPRGPRRATKHREACARQCGDARSPSSERLRTPSPRK